MTVTRIDVFGGLRAIGRGDVFSPFSVRPGGFLALLVLARGQPIGTSQTVDWLWGANAAPSAGNQLQRLVGQLRRQFEPGLEARSAGSVILGAPDGYRLGAAVQSDLFDLDRQVAEPQWTTAERARVLRTVRKPPFAGLERVLADHPSYVAVERQCASIGIDALGDEATLGDGYREIVNLVEVLASRFQFEEQLQASLVRALGSVGRRSEAMTLYERVRTSLRDELGIDPGLDLQAAHQDVLAVHRPVAPAREGLDAHGLDVAVHPKRGDVVRVSDESRLIGRDRELARLGEFAQSVRRGEGATLVVRGEAGVGKSALLKALTEMSPGCGVAAVSGVESEMELPFAGLHLLCEPLLARIEGLPIPQREALEVAFGLRSGEAPNRLIVGLAALRLLTLDAAERPLLCVVDDAQWVDTASLQALSVAARRLPPASLGFVFAVRAESAVRYLDDLPELRLSGLDPTSSSELLRLAMPGFLDVQVQDRLIAEARGNPLALLELPRSVTPADRPGGPEPFPSARVPNQIEEIFTQRVLSLPDPSRLLLLLAAAEPIGDVGLLWDAAARLGVPPEAAGPAEDADLIHIGPWVRFRHPLVRSAAYRAASAEQRRRVHEALALATDGTADPDRRAWHRARAVSGRDDEVAGELERSASRAQARGGIAAAAAFLARSAELTVDDWVRVDRAISAASAKVDAALPGEALELIVLAEAGSPDDLQTARLMLLRARLSRGPGTDSIAARRLSEAAVRFETLDPTAASETHLEAMLAAHYAGRLGTGALADVAVAAENRRNRQLPPSSADLVLDGLALRQTVGHTAAGPVFRRALESYRSAPHALSRQCFASNLAAGDLWDADSWLDLSNRQVKLARDGGLLNLLPTALNYLASFWVFVGDFATVRELLREADDAAAIDQVVRSTYVTLELAAWTGDHQLFEVLAAEAQATAKTGGDGTLVTIVEYARAVLANSVGDYEVAFDAARVVIDTNDMPTASWAFCELLEAAARLDRSGVDADLERLVERAQSSGTDWALGTAALGRALMAVDTDANYRAAVRHLGTTQMVLQRARAQLLYGEWLRRSERIAEARVQLRAAEEVFAGVGSPAFLARARSELAAGGAENSH